VTPQDRLWGTDMSLQIILGRAEAGVGVGAQFNCLGQTVVWFMVGTCQDKKVIAA
jgi:hypothetical protein